MALALIPTLLLYCIGLLVVKRLSLTGVTQFVGFLVAWGGAALCAMLIAKQPTVASAQQSIVLASLISSVVAIVGIAIAGDRKAPKADPPRPEGAQGERDG